ncbi:MAG: hypothetical protein JSW52_10920 [Candidatus Coatesbacteria bacterium]|nr:MAG: hypothetical protein JSW52_10920 [Candidatus Coatesbacteria bacterium]
MAGIFKWVFENIAPGETDPEKRVDADRVMDNFYALARSNANKRALGADAEDGNSNGVSTQDQCNITVLTVDGVGGLLELNDEVIVSDGTSVWSLTNVLTDDELSFNDSHLAKGSGPSDYSDPGFIDGLDIKITGFKDVLGKDQLILAGSHAQKITGEDIETSASDAKKLGVAVTDVQSQVDVSLEPNGSLKSALVAVENIASDAMLEENDGNLVFGMMEYDWDNDGYANGWRAYNDPTGAELSSEQSVFGDRSQKVTASQPDDGIVNDPDECRFDVASYKGRGLSAAAYVYCSTDDTVVIEVYDGIGASASEAGGTAGAWERIYVTREIDGSATDLQVRIYATEATVFYVDEVHVCLGRLPVGFHPHSDEQIRQNVSEANLTNYCPNSGFAEWSSGDQSLPDLWGGNGAVQNNPNGLFGEGCAAVSFDIGEKFFMDVPKYRDFRERTVYFNAYVQLDNGVNALRMQVDDGVGTTYRDVVPGFGWQRRGVRHTVDPDATMLRISFENQDGGNITVLIDGVMLTVDRYPIGYKPATVYKPFVVEFGLAGTVVDGFMEGPGGVTTGVPIPFPGIIQSLYVREGVPGIGDDSFKVYVGGALYADYDVTLGNGETGVSAGVAAADAVELTPGAYVQIYCDAAAMGAGSDAVAVLKGITWV